MKIKSRPLRRILRGIGILILLAVVGIAILVATLYHSKPAGQAGPAADALADKMLAAVNADAWENVHVMEWNFRDHKHLWDRKNNLAQSSWGDYRALMDPDEMRVVIYQDGKRISESEELELKDQALNYFWNDSFWAIAFLKVKDPDTVRELVKLDNGDEALLVTYESGGSTPGDSYLWYLNADGRPNRWRMWTQIIPVGGLEFTWEDWQQLPGGAWIATNHGSSIFDIPIENLKTGQRLGDLGHPEDLFAPLNP